jgi:hypothetical protein
LIIHISRFAHPARRAKKKGSKKKKNDCNQGIHKGLSETS